AGPGRRRRLGPHHADRPRREERLRRRWLQAPRGGLLHRAVRADAAARRRRFPPRREPRARAPVSHRGDPTRLRSLARPARRAESAAFRHVLHPGPGGVAVVLRVRWLAASIALIAAAATAQIDKLDLRLPKVTDGV